jgi:hypothetical protein
MLVLREKRRLFGVEFGDRKVRRLPNPAVTVARQRFVPSTVVMMEGKSRFLALHLMLILILILILIRGAIFLLSSRRWRPA